MEATGSVTIISRDQVGQGDRGIYDKDENKVYLYGNVSLSQGPNVIKGRDEKSYIVYDLTSGRANVMGGATSLFAPGSNAATRGSISRPSSAGESSARATAAALTAPPPSPSASRYGPALTGRALRRRRGSPRRAPATRCRWRCPAGA